MEESIADFARRLDEDSAWLTRKLHDQTPAHLGDITGWALALGVHVLPGSDDSAELRTQWHHESGYSASAE